VRTVVRPAQFHDPIGGQMLSLVDAGIDFNLPMPPTLHACRAADVVLVLDYSATTRAATRGRALMYELSIDRPCHALLNDEADTDTVSQTS